ncbi:MAG: hypothetical protein GF334_05380 [Candidatus Altiarchaeales archaeon]|nr:hypothetical protein [Candidatus Altiarchaeales archaeon]
MPKGFSEDLKDMSYDELFELAQQTHGECSKRMKKIERRARKLIRDSLCPGAIIGLKHPVNWGMRGKKIIVRKCKGNTVEYQEINSKGEVRESCYYVTRRKGKGKRRKVKRVYRPTFMLGAPGVSVLDQVASVRVDDTLVFRRSDFLRKEKASRILTR